VKIACKLDEVSVRPTMISDITLPHSNGWYAGLLECLLDIRKALAWSEANLSLKVFQTVYQYLPTSVFIEAATGELLNLFLVRFSKGESSCISA
jgi:hypothetical protein